MAPVDRRPAAGHMLAAHHSRAVDHGPATLQLPLAGNGGTIVAVTDAGDDPRYAVVRDAAVRLAVAVGGARILLFHEPGPLAPERGTARAFVADGRSREHTGSRAIDMLRDAVAAMRAEGLEVGIWLPPRPGAAALADAVIRVRADLVLMPAARRRPWSIDRTLEYRAARIPAPVVAVDIDGAMRAVRPLAGHRLPMPSVARRREVLA
jgi:hypothetical protein